LKLHTFQIGTFGTVVTTRPIAPGAKLLAIEHVIGPPNELPVSKFTDINMLVMLGAQERTEQQFSALLAASGFTLFRIIPATLGYCIMGACKVVGCWRDRVGSAPVERE